MIGARMNTLASLRGSIERLEAHGFEAHGFEALGETPGRHKAALGHAGVDAALQGGLAIGAMHEVFAEGHQGGTATGFVAGLAGRVSSRRPLVWVRQDFADLESGALSMSGLTELGLDPRLLVSVRAADTDSALRTAADALACEAVGTVVLEVWGEPRQLDLVASRKLTLAAQASGVTCLVLRVAAAPQPSTAETRWIVRAAHSPPATFSNVWGAPVFDAQLVRNRHGRVGRWIMEWKCDECLFNEPAAYPQPVVAAPAHRPHQAPARAQSVLRSDRRAG
jgi:protein ImuA